MTRIPPQDLNAEQSVLGAILVENESISRVTEILQPSDFYRETHAKIHRAMIDLADRREPIDLITLGNCLRSRGDWDSVGGTGYLASLCDTTPTAANVAYYCRIVKEAAQKRSLLIQIRECEESLYSGDELLPIAGRLSSHLSHLQDGTRTFRPIGNVLIDTLKRIEKASESESLITGIPTGFDHLDRALGGIHPGELVIIAARPSMGKTALAGDIARGAAERAYGVAFVTAESPDHEVVRRLLARATGIENRDLRRGKLADHELPMLAARAATLGKLPIWLLDAERGWDLIKAKIRSLKLREPNISLVCVDYVGLLSAPVQKGNERYLEIGRISSEAKSLALELEVGFILLSQLNREVETRGDGRPKLSDLRESGNLEQDADVVGLIYRESKYNDEAPKDKAELIIAKHRNGETGMIPLRFDARTVSFSDCETSDQGNGTGRTQQAEGFRRTKANGSQNIH